MSILIENAAACEIRSVIHFLNTKKVKSSEIYWQICKAFGKNAMSDSMVRRWVRQFNEGCDQVHDEERSRRKTVNVQLVLLLWNFRKSHDYYFMDLLL